MSIAFVTTYLRSRLQRSSGNSCHSVFINKEDYYERLREGIGSNFHTENLDDAVFDKTVKEAIDKVVANYADEDGQTFIDDWDAFENEMYWLAVKMSHLDDD